MNYVVAQIADVPLERVDLKQSELERELTFPVDETITSLTITATGQQPAMVVYTPSGTCRLFLVSDI